MYTLVTLPGSCSTGIHILLNSLNIQAEVVKRDDIPNYTDRVATNQVPALLDGETVLPEGAAIILYLFEKHNIDMASFGNATAFKQWLMFNYATLHPAYGQLFTVNGQMADSEAKTTYLNQLAEKVSNTWQVVEQRLSQSPYLAGDKPSVLDYLLAVYINWGNYFPELTINVGDNVKRVVNEVSQHQAFVDAFADEGASFKLPQGI